MKKNQGVSLVALIIMIIVMIIIAGIALNSGIGSYDKALEAKSKEERHQVKNAVSTRFGDYTMNPSLKPLLGEQIPDDYFMESDPDARIQAIKVYLLALFISEGRLQTNSWQSTDGSKRSRLEVVASRVQFLVKQDQSQDKANVSENEYVSDSNVEIDEEVPF